MSLLTELIPLNEIFNSTVLLTWKNEDDQMTASFAVDEKQYQCFISAGLFTFQETDLHFLNVSFSRIGNDGDQIFDITLDTKNSIKVLGAVINGISEKVKELKTDAILLGAIDNIEQRMRIYRWVARQFAMTFGVFLEKVKVPNGELAMLIHNGVDKKLVNEFVVFVKQKNLEK
jgi:hypothetical protein